MLCVSKSHRASFVCAAAIAATLTSSAAMATVYQLDRVVPLASGQFGLGATPRINSANHVATGGILGGVSYYDGTSSSRQTLDDEIDIYGMNDSNVMVGSGFSFAQSRYTPVIATPTSITFLPLFNDLGAPAAANFTAINNSGLAVGYYGNPGTPSSNSFYYDTTTSTRTDFNISPVGGSTGAYSVSTTGKIVGTTNVVGGSAAFTYDPATSSTFILPNPSGVGATAGKGLTGTGTIIGVSVSGSVTGVNLEQGTPYTYTSDGTFTSLTVPAGWNAATIEDINSQGDFVGSLINGGTRVGYVNKGGIYTILSGANLQSGGPVNAVYGINDAGYISVTDAFAFNSVISILKPVPAALLGDVNLDGIVDQLDLNLVNSHWQQTNAGLALGDANEDGIVDQLDLNLVNSNWQHTASGFSLNTVVPEPASLGLLTLAALPLLRRRRSV